MKLKMQNIMIDSWNFITIEWDILQVKTVQTLLALTSGWEQPDVHFNLCYFKKHLA